LMRKSLPNLITTANLMLGMAAMMIAISDSYQIAAILVMVGMVLDGLDGRIARAFHAESEFGRELDSLSDIVTFGVAPAVIVYVAYLHTLGLTGDLVAALFPVAGALRLARFNTASSQTNYFVGLPITAAGGILAAFSLYRGLLVPEWLPILTVALSYLMVSRTRYPNFKQLALPSTAAYVIPLMVAMAGLLFLRHRDLVPGLVFVVLVVYGGYGVYYDVRSLWRRRRKRLHERLHQSGSK